MNAFLAEQFYRLHERLLHRPTFRLWQQLEQSQYWPHERIRALQMERLTRLMRIGYQHSAYWREVMDQASVDPGSADPADALRRLPLLTKEIIRDQRERMVWRDEGPRIQIARTSGSTNAALEFYTSSNREAYVSAARMRGHRSIGIRPGDKEVYFWGAPVELGRQDRIKHVRDWLRNDLLTNAVEIAPETVPQYVESWKRWGANCIFGYVGSFTTLVRMARQGGVDLGVLPRHGLRALVTTSEMLTDGDRADLEQAFGVPAYDSFGLREAGLIGHECDQKTMHTNDELLLLETIDPQTLEPTAGEGELVVTNLASDVMPIIRYRTGDIVRLSNQPCPCGRTLGRVKVTGGRLMDFVVSSSGKWVSTVAFLYIVRQVKGVLQLQVRQETLGEITLLLAVDPKEFPPDGERRIVEATRARMASDDRINVQYVDGIQPAASGKYRPVISTVAEQIIRDSKGSAPARQ